MRSLALLAALAALAGGCLTTHGTAEAPVVSAVRFEGVRALPQGLIADRLATHAPEGFLLREGIPLDTDALAVDRRRIETWYRQHGYYGARVIAADVTPAGAGRVRVTFRVEEGEPIRVRKVTVTGFDAAPEAMARAGPLPIAEGRVFEEASYDGARNAIAAALHATGWADAQVRHSALVVPEEGVAEVAYAVEPGPRLRFGGIEVRGAAVVPAERIRTKAAQALEPGAWFDETRLEAAQARVFEMGLFGGVRVQRGATDAANGVVPVEVQVSEAPLRSLSAGPGVAFQQNRWEGRLSGRWTHRDFLGGLRRFSADGRAGWAFLPTPFAPVKEGFVSLVGAELLEPDAFGSGQATTLRVELERSIEEAYSFWSERARLGAPIRLGRRASFVPTYAFEAYEVEGIAGTEAVRSAPLLASCGGRLCVLSYLEQRFALDLRDDPVEPRRGTLFAVSVQEGFRIGTLGYQYLRFLPEVRAFLPLGRRAVLAARARAGGLVPVKEASPPPIVARFSGGGPASMRGYRVGRLSPMQRQDGEWVPVGGNGMVDGSLELRVDATSKLALALFLDAGNVSKPDADGLAWLSAADPVLLHYAAGVGVRYRTPAGPLRLDVGIRIPNPLAPREEPRGVPVLSDACSASVTSSPGCHHEEPLAAVHLSLGEVF